MAVGELPHGCTDVAILIGSFGWFFMWFLLFVRCLPVVAIAEIKEILPPPMRSHSGAHAAGHDRLTEELPDGLQRNGASVSGLTKSDRNYRVRLNGLHR